MISPVNTVPKSDSDERRVISDLSWPHGASVNSGISKDTYLNEFIALHYTSVEEVCRLVLEVGRGATIYKRDLRHAYRQIPVDPRDYCYLGYTWNGSFYFDTVLAMGQKNAAMACSRTTDSVMFMHSKDGFHGVNYLEDLIGVEKHEVGAEAYEALGTLLAELGLLENVAKASPPDTKQIVLGVEIDTVNLTVSITKERMLEIEQLLIQWMTKHSAKKVELQSLIGKLCFVTKCVRQSRIFLNRMFALLRSMDTNQTVVKLTESFKKDIRWWQLFVGEYNGVSFIPSPVWFEPDVTFSTDSCLTGCGGVCGREYFHVSFPDNIKDLDLPIHKLELLAVLLGVRIWGHQCESLKLQIYCDNDASVNVINSSKTKDPFMATCIRELWLEVSKFNFELRAVHLPGVENRVADCLSRWDLHPKYKAWFDRFIGNEIYHEVVIESEMFNFSGEL